MDGVVFEAYEASFPLHSRVGELGCQCWLRDLVRREGICGFFWGAGEKSPSCLRSVFFDFRKPNDSSFGGLNYYDATEGLRHLWAVDVVVCVLLVALGRYSSTGEKAGLRAVVLFSFLFP